MCIQTHMNYASLREAQFIYRISQYLCVYACLCENSSISVVKIHKLVYIIS